MFFLSVEIRSLAADTTYVRFNTTLGNIDVQLLSDEAPLTVANFLQYVDHSDYSNSFFHRSISGFIIQGGGFNITSDNSIGSVVNYGTVTNEFHVSNTRGTLALAKLSSGPSTGSNQWFFNEADNSANLDSQNGGFTVFGKVANPSSLAVMDSISGVSTPLPPPLDPDYANYPVGLSPEAVFDAVPLINYDSSVGVLISNLIFVNSITRVTLTDFSTWQTSKFTSTQQQNTAFTDPAAAPFNDGVPNLMKYLYDIDPSRNMTATDRLALPIFSTVTSGSSTYLVLKYRQSNTVTGLSIAAQTSADMVTWTTVSNANPFQIGTDTTTGDPLMEIAAPASSSAKFIRLQVTGS